MLIPKNELGAIVLFSQKCEYLGFEIVSIGAKYPDAIIRDVRTGIEYRAEFEFLASNFIMHGHDPRECDVIICWKNDLNDCVLPVIEVSSSNAVEITLPSELEREVMYLRIQNSKLKNQNRKLERSRAIPSKIPSKNKKSRITLGTPPDDRPGWRIEIFSKGRYFNWRRGSGKDRECRYGGRVVDVQKNS